VRKIGNPSKQKGQVRNAEHKREKAYAFGLLAGLRKVRRYLITILR
jgi:hypothetical protein